MLGTEKEPIKVHVDCDGADEAINKLSQIKQLLIEIKELFGSMGN